MKVLSAHLIQRLRITSYWLRQYFFPIWKACDTLWEVEYLLVLNFAILPRKYQFILLFSRLDIKSIKLKDTAAQRGCVIFLLGNTSTAIWTSMVLGKLLQVTISRGTFQPQPFCDICNSPNLFQLLTADQPCLRAEKQHTSPSLADSQYSWFNTADLANTFRR